MSQSAKRNNNEEDLLFTPVGMLGGSLVGATIGAYVAGKQATSRKLDDTIAGAGYGGFLGIFAGGLWVFTLPLSLVGLAAVGGAYAIDEIPFQLVIVDKKGSGSSSMK